MQQHKTIQQLIMEQAEWINSEMEQIVNFDKVDMEQIAVELQSTIYELIIETQR